MLCRSCKRNVETTMRHAIAANSCPFCGNAIFDATEFAFRKSVSRVLIKNGLENDDLINKIVDDILALAAGTERSDDGTASVAVTPIIPAGPSAATEDEKVAKFQAQAEALARAKAAANVEEDGLTPAERNAPSRVLTPAPKPTAQTATKAGEDPIAMAMREFEAAQNLDQKFAREDKAADSSAVTAEDLAGVFFMEAGVASEKAERLKGAATSSRPAFRRS